MEKDSKSTTSSTVVSSTLSTPMKTYVLFSLVFLSFQFYTYIADIQGMKKIVYASYAIDARTASGAHAASIDPRKTLPPTKESSNNSTETATAGNSEPHVAVNVSSSSSNDTSAHKPIHVLYGLKGNATDFFDEFDVALKSLLINSPLDHPLVIHIMVSPEAIPAFLQMARKANIEGSKWRMPIEIKIYNITMAHEQQMRQRINEKMNCTDGIINERVGMGSFYRLFAADVLPHDTGSVIYMDTDIVVLGNIQELQPYIKDDYIIQIHMSAGFIIVNINKMNEFWERVPIIQNNLHCKFDDQIMIAALRRNFKRSFGKIPLHWATDLSPPKIKTISTINDTEFSSALHFSGQYKGSFFDMKTGVSKHCTGACSNESKPENALAYKSTWGLADYYVYLPWEWALHFGRGQINPGEDGYPLEIGAPIEVPPFEQSIEQNK